MSDQLTNTGTNSAIIPEIWSQSYYDVLLAELPFNPIISRQWEGEIAALGDRVNISSIPEFDDAGLLPEDAAGQADAVTVLGQQLVINKRAYKDAIINRTALLQSLPFVEELRQKMIYALMKRVQREIIDDSIPAVANQLNWGTGTTADLTDILDAKTALDNANVPAANRHFVFGPSQMNDLFEVNGFVSSDFLLSGAPLQTGELATSLLGFQPHMTTEVGDVGYFFHQSYMTMAAQEGMNVTEYNLGGQGARAVRVNSDTLFGIRLLDNERLVTKA